MARLPGLTAANPSLHIRPEYGGYTCTILGAGVPVRAVWSAGTKRDAFESAKTAIAAAVIEGLCALNNTGACLDCGACIPSGDMEPCSGLCEPCEAARGDYEGYQEAIEEARWIKRERDDERYERERDGRRESERDYAEWARQTECHD